MRSGILALVLLLAACESDRAILSGALETEFAACSERLVKGELNNQGARATCDHWSAVGAMDKWAMTHKYGDLVALLTAKREELALLVDAGALSLEEADARNETFYAQFLEEIAQREKRYNANYTVDYLNYCEIDGDNLLCTRPPGPDVAFQVQNEIREDCERRESIGEIVSLEGAVRCELKQMLKWRKKNQLINNDLAELAVDRALWISRQVDAGKITVEQAVEEIESFKDQCDEEKRERGRLADSGDQNWRNRECRIEDDVLKCEQI